jgi:hypothetical protein
VMSHRLDAAHVRLFNHVKLHRLMLAVLGRLLDFAGLFERDLYFAMLALIYRAELSPHIAFGKGGPKALGRGEIIKARGRLKDATIRGKLSDLFGLASGGAVHIRNNLAHFNMLNPARACGPMIDLTAQVNAARRLMAYDRKLKNAVTQSVIELVAREGLHLSWEMDVGGEHALVNAKLRGKQAKHLKGLKVFEHENGKNRRFHDITESLHGRHLVEMAATLFAGSAVVEARDLSALPLRKIDWEESVRRMNEKK